MNLWLPVSHAEWRKEMNGQFYEGIEWWQIYKNVTITICYSASILKIYSLRSNKRMVMALNYQLLFLPFIIIFKLERNSSQPACTKGQLAFCQEILN